MIICAGDIESFSFAKPIGIGLIESAINLTQIITRYCPDKLIFIGTAGSYGDFKIFDTVLSSSASNIELCFLNNECYSPLENIIKIENQKSQTIVNSSNYISTNFEVSKKFNLYGIGIENMEFFSVLSCAKKFNINVVGIFVVTNFCNANAHSDFIANHKMAMNILENYLAQHQIVSRETKGEIL
jgi:purine-nucleoside phosphorylase